MLLVKGRQARKAPWTVSNSLFSCFPIPDKQLGSDISSSLPASVRLAFLKGDSILEVCLCRLQCQPAYYEQGQWVICSMRLLCFFPVIDRGKEEEGREASPPVSLVFRCDYPPSVFSSQLHKLILISN